MIKPEVKEGKVIELNDLCLKMIQHLKDHQAEEPEAPNGDDDRWIHEEKAALHYEWSRAHQAIRLMLGIQLVHLAEEQL